MDLSYLLVLIMCFFSLFIGVLISVFAKEELKDGKKYFVFCRKIIFALIIFALIYFLKISLIINIFITIILLFVLFKFKEREFVLFNFLGIIFYLSSLNTDLFKINAPLIFIYGILTASVFTEENIKLKKFDLIKKLMLNYIWFLVIGLIFYFIQ